ncbi:hypothetical protein FRC03_012276 [Tulasnella sp. 419]|nr:hypothetical protein FRC03_012276 [Tulasnella sp. 419]
MDIFSTVGTAMSLVGGIRAIFDQVGQNTDECALLSAEVVKSLLKIQEFWEQHSLSPPTQLRDIISEFEMGLSSINASLESLLKPAKGGLASASKAKISEIYNVNDIKNQLVTLRQRLHTCHQQLQIWCTLDVASRVAAMQANIDELREQLQVLIPNLNPERPGTPEQIEKQASPASILDPATPLQQDVIRIQTRDSLQSSPSSKTSKLSRRSFSPSFVDKQYIKEKMKEISNVFSQVRDEGFRDGSFAWFNRFRALEDISSAMGRSESVRETLRVLEVLQSGRRAPYIDTAKCFLRLGRALHGLDMPDEARMMYNWGVQTCFKLAALRSPKCLFDLTRCLHNLSLNLDKSEHSADAQWVFEHAIDAREQLQAKEQKAYFVALASFLMSKGKRLQKQKRLEACCKLTKEAVEVYRYLVGVDEETYVLHLSWSLRQLSTYLSQAGLHADAVRMEEEVISIYRNLVEQDGKTYLPILTDSLRNLVRKLNSIGRAEEVIKMREEAIRMGRELIKVNRKTYLPDLVMELYSYAACVRDIGRSEEAVEMEDEAIQMHRELVERDAKTHLPDFSRSLHNLATHLAGIGRFEEAVMVGAEAVGMHQVLVEWDRNTYLPRLSDSLHNLAVDMNKIRMTKEAVNVGKEAVQIGRELIEMDRKTHLPGFSLSLHNLALHLNAIRRFEGAVRVGKEAVALRRELVKMDSGYTAKLIKSLQDLAVYLRNMGRLNDAKMVEEELSKIHSSKAESVLP